jgi:general stress protein YciG
MTEELPKPKSKRGFASMSPEKQREIARKGGKSVPSERRSFSQDIGLAAMAGQKGGRALNPRIGHFPAIMRLPRRLVLKAAVLPTGARRRSQASDCDRRAVAPLKRPATSVRDPWREALTEQLEGVLSDFLAIVLPVAGPGDREDCAH